VFALLGEGIIPATWCADLFVSNMHDLQAYRDAVLKKFEIYSLIFKFVQLKIQGRFSMVRHGADMLKIYRHMKGHEDRYGMGVRMVDMLKVAKV
jgi:hypothetical protein